MATSTRSSARTCARRWGRTAGERATEAGGCSEASCLVSGESGAGQRCGANDDESSKRPVVVARGAAGRDGARGGAGGRGLRRAAGGGAGAGDPGEQRHGDL